MAKSEILKQLANNEISLEIALSRLMVIASDINNQALEEWAQKELTGYEINDTIPSYRILGAGAITYNGINGSFHMEKQPLAITIFPPQVREGLKENRIYQSIGVLQDFAKEKNADKVGRDLTMLSEYVLKTQGIRCYRIRMNHSYADFQETLDKIRTTLLIIFIKLDKEFGNLDKLDINVSGFDVDGEKLNTINDGLIKIIYSDDGIDEG